MDTNRTLLRLAGVALSVGTFACSGESPLAPSTGDAPAAATSSYSANTGGAASASGPFLPPVAPAHTKGFITAVTKVGIRLDNGTSVLVTDTTSITVDGKTARFEDVKVGQAVYAEGTWVQDSGPTSRTQVLQAALVNAASQVSPLPLPEDATNPHTGSKH
jgi:hypothetical protein